MKYGYFLILCLCIIRAGTQAELIGQFSNSGSGGAYALSWPDEPLNPDDFGMSFLYLEDGVGRPSNTIWFDLTGSDVGKTAYATNQTHANFAKLSSLLIDGTNQMFIAVLWWPEDEWGRTGDGEPFWENQIIKTVSTYPDFTGLNVGTIAITLEQFDYQYPWYEPHDPGATWHHLDYAFTVSFYSDVIPEPTTLLLLGMGGVLIRKRK